MDKFSPEFKKLLAELLSEAMKTAEKEFEDGTLTSKNDFIVGYIKQAATLED